MGSAALGGSAVILTTLSMQRVGYRTPHVPSNDDRLRAYRAAAPVQMGNALPWKWTEAQRYAKREAMDARTHTTDTGF